MSFNLNEALLELKDEGLNAKIKGNWLVIANNKATIILEQLCDELYYVVKMKCRQGPCIDKSGKIVDLEDVIRYMKSGFFD
jgi:hypothetical protein